MMVCMLCNQQHYYITHFLNKLPCFPEINCRVNFVFMSDCINLIFLSTSDKTLRGFEPVYPDNLCIDLKTFCNAFPFHIVFDEEVSDG